MHNNVLKFIMEMEPCLVRFIQTLIEKVRFGIFLYAVEPGRQTRQPCLSGLRAVQTCAVDTVGHFIVTSHDSGSASLTWKSNSNEETLIDCDSREDPAHPLGGTNYFISVEIMKSSKGSKLGDFLIELSSVLTD